MDALGRSPKFQKKKEFHVDKRAENPTDFILYLEEKIAFSTFRFVRFCLSTIFTDTVVMTRSELCSGGNKYIKVSL